MKGSSGLIVAKKGVNLGRNDGAEIKQGPSRDQAGVNFKLSEL
jgi:hypothetical protein